CSKAWLSPNGRRGSRAAAIPPPLPLPARGGDFRKGKGETMATPPPCLPWGEEPLKGAKPGDGAAEAVVELDRWLPAQRVLGSPDIGPAGPGVVLGER